MKQWSIFLFFILNSAVAGTIVLEKRAQNFTNQNCEQTDSCDLKEFALLEETKKTTISGQAHPSFSTDVRYVLKTADKADVTEYGIVQWIRGCQFSSTPSGKKRLDISRHYMTGMALFQHKNWSIDSDNEDPVYTSYKGQRHALWRFNKNPKSFDPETASFYRPEKLPHPVVFATDLPGSFTADEAVAKNSSLEFEVCIFKMRDLPSTSTPEGDGIFKGDALKCFKWESKFIYDFKTKSYKTGGAIDPVCLGDQA